MKKRFNQAPNPDQKTGLARFISEHKAKNIGSLAIVAGISLGIAGAASAGHNSVPNNAKMPVFPAGVGQIIRGVGDEKINLKTKPGESLVIYSAVQGPAVLRMDPIASMPNMPADQHIGDPVLGHAGNPKNLKWYTSAIIELNNGGSTPALKRDIVAQVVVPEPYYHWEIAYQSGQNVEGPNQP